MSRLSRPSARSGARSTPNVRAKAARHKLKRAATAKTPNRQPNGPGSVRTASSWKSATNRIAPSDLEVSVRNAKRQAWPSARDCFRPSCPCRVSRSDRTRTPQDCHLEPALAAEPHLVALEVGRGAVVHGLRPIHADRTGRVGAAPNRGSPRAGCCPPRRRWRRRRGCATGGAAWHRSAWSGWSWSRTSRPTRAREEWLRR